MAAWGRGMTNSSSPSPDITLLAVSTAEEMFKACVRAAHREDRYRLWRAFSQGLEEAQERAQESGDAMPWEDPAAVTVVSAKAIQDVLEGVLIACLPTPAERVRVAKAAFAVYERATAAGSNGARIKSTKYGVRVCARPGCGQRFGARNYRHTYCSGACRTGAYEARQRLTARSPQT
jgi:hypothetical protein